MEQRCRKTGDGNRGQIKGTSEKGIKHQGRQRGRHSITPVVASSRQLLGSPWLRL